MGAGSGEERRCRFCGTPLADTFVDLGVSPLANSYLKAADLDQMEPFYPLHTYVCSECFLVQLTEQSRPQDIFSEYAYFSSYSDSWLKHAADFAGEAIKRFALDSNSRIVEIGSNDGYLLRFFMEAGIPSLGIEPAANIAAAARERGIETVVSFFNSRLAGELVAAGKEADLLIGNNVLAHIPGTNDLLKGMKELLKPDGVISMEFPHLLSLMEQNQFDTIYHEHYSYYSLGTAARIFAAHGLPLFDVELLPTHGGSLRIFAAHAENNGRRPTGRLEDLLETEREKGLLDLKTYRAFDTKVKKVKREILKFLIEIKNEGKSVAGYGAPAKGNTLLNYCGIGTDFIDYTVDRSPHKQGLYLPGSRIPVYEPEKIFETKPDYVLILPWNLREEIAGQIRGIRDWGGRFVVFIPQVEVF
ncbi:MAG: SAM-dependent methyltransferase [Firmicutes bacterium ML8_F2]|nr:MAG: SAM-dependent methyltransferase [Firmicutes bacterium ML8_F2]